jgi:hypothetical protein
MAALTSTAVQCELEEDCVLLRAVLIRATQEVKEYMTQYEDQYKLVNALGTAMNASENKSVLDILAMRECRLDVALVRESNAISTLANFCLAEKGALHAQSAAATTALSPPLVDGATTTSASPATWLGTSGKKIMKRKLPEPNDGRKNH